MTRVTQVRALLLVSLLVCASCSTTRYHIVRHGEKLNETDNSPLNEAGFRRAEALAAVMADKNIGRIYVSDKQRTQQTAAPTADLFNLEPIVIPKDETAQLISQLEEMSGTSVLVVRHSEEIHQIVNALSPSDTISPIPDEFDNLYVIRRRVFLLQTDIRLDRLQYGQ